MHKGMKYSRETGIGFFCTGLLVLCVDFVYWNAISC